MIKIGVCDVNEDETCRTVYLLKSQIKFDDIDEKNVTIAMYTFESVILDIEEHKFDCDIFITELSFHNGDNGVKLANVLMMLHHLVILFSMLIKSQMNWIYMNADM